MYDDLLMASVDGPTCPMKGKVVLERVIITTTDGRLYDLGRPTHPLFRFRVLKYKWQRRAEFRAAKGASNG